jgi:hypothetical protein
VMSYWELYYTEDVMSYWELYYTEDAQSRLLKNVGTYLQNHTTQ